MLKSVLCLNEALWAPKQIFIAPIQPYNEYWQN